MKTLKNYVCTHAHQEESIAKGYRMEDMLGFCMEYMKDYTGTQRVWDAEEDPIIRDEVIRCSVPKQRRMSDEVHSYAHAFVINNAPCLESWRE